MIGWIKLTYSSSISQSKHENMFEVIHENDSTSKQAKFEEYLVNYQKQLAHFMYTHFASIRINRLFDIVIDFPDSKNAIDDLKICLTKTNLKSHLIISLKQSIEQRLLHPGVNTSDTLY